MNICNWWMPSVETNGTFPCKKKVSFLVTILSLRIILKYEYAYKLSWYVLLEELLFYSLLHMQEWHVVIHRSKVIIDMHFLRICHILQQPERASESHRNQSQQTAASFGDYYHPNWPPSPPHTCSFLASCRMDAKNLQWLLIHRFALFAPVPLLAAVIWNLVAWALI